MQKTTSKIAHRNIKSELSSEQDSSLIENDGGVTESQDTIASALTKVRQVGAVASKAGIQKNKKIKEINGPKGLEPTRYGDWESKGRCFDF